MRALETLRIFVRQLRAERRLSERARGFRSADAASVAQAYGEMSEQDFEDINGPQSWLNARLIPRALALHAPRTPRKILDLGCGSGASSALLLQHAPQGSSLLGYDVCEKRLASARRRIPSAAQFVRQAIDSTYCDPEGRELPDASIDIVHSAGVVGHHLDAPAVRRLAREIRRTLARDGLVILDAGPRISARALRELLHAEGFRCVRELRAHPFARRAAACFVLASA